MTIQKYFLFFHPQNLLCCKCSGKKGMEKDNGFIKIPYKYSINLKLDIQITESHGIFSKNILPQLVILFLENHYYASCCYALVMMNSFCL